MHLLLLKLVSMFGIKPKIAAFCLKITVTVSFVLDARQYISPMNCVIVRISGTNVILIISLDSSIKLEYKLLFSYQYHVKFGWVPGLQVTVYRSMN